MLEDLKKVIAEERVESVAILALGSPDPDALGSAFCLSHILKHLDVKSKIYCEKEISYPNNQTMVNSLDISIHKMSDLKDAKHYAILDFQYRDFPNAKCILHIDHHKEMPSSALCSVVDISSGATSTIITKLLEESAIKDSKVMPKIALGLAYGIYTDTKCFFQAGPKDFEALSYLKQYYDAEHFRLLTDVKHSVQTMEVIRKALEHNQVKGTFAYSGIGYVSPAYRDSIAIAADFLLSQEGILNVLVFGVIEDQHIVNGCFRTNDPSIDVDKFMKAFVRHGSGGGRKSAGAFQEPLGFFDTCPSKDLVWELVRITIEERIKTKINLTKADRYEG
jgi:nanoRNase/pAp phosphatase (c-di-AMP/oligoRNAs hydrolase)